MPIQQIGKERDLRLENSLEGTLSDPLQGFSDQSNQSSNDSTSEVIIIITIITIETVL